MKSFQPTFLVFGVYWVYYLNVAHSTFENYYAFRGCQTLVDRTITIKENRLYKLVNGSDYGEHVLEIQVEDVGLDTFTFG